MKKLVILFCLGMVFSSCTVEDYMFQEDDLETITLWHYYLGSAKESFEKLVTTFNETVGKEKSIYVDVYAYASIENLSEELFRASKKELGASDLPDIFSSYIDNVYRMDEISLVASLDTYFTSEELENYRPEFLTEGRFDEQGNLKMMPVAKSTEVIFINATDFAPFSAELGLTKGNLETWESIAHIASLYYDWTDAKTPEENDGSAFFGIDSLSNFLIVGARQLGYSLFTEDQGMVTFNFTREHAKKVWDCFYVPYVSGHFTSKLKYRGDDARVGTVIAYIGSTAGAVHFPKNVERENNVVYAIESLVMPFPIFTNAKNVMTQRGAGMAVVKSNPAREKAAVEFFKWFTHVDQNIDFASNMGYIPVQRDTASPQSLDCLYEKTTNKTVALTGKVVYSILDDYQFFSPKPFKGSFDANVALQTELESFAVKGAKLVQAGVTSNLERDEVIADLVCEEKFDQWYSDFTQKIEKIINN